MPSIVVSGRVFVKGRGFYQTGCLVWLRRYGVRRVGIIHFQVLPQTAFEVLNRTKVPPFEKPAGQDGEPEFYLIKPPNRG